METVDVVILGGGLAGLTLARELALARPQTSIRVFEKRATPPPIAAHKVGESCVEIAGHWFVNVLGLGDHLAEEHLPKLGLRFFWGTGPVGERVELGPIANKVPNPFEGLLLPSYQLDRGVLERHLADELGDSFVAGATVKDVQPGQVEVEIDGVRTTLAARQIIDATGRAGLLKKRLPIDRESPHAAHAAWFRVKGHVKVDEWSDQWQIDMPEAVRWRSTCHFMGPGYWVWLIPLATDHMSVGIVTGAESHDFASLATFDRAMDWLRTHEPLLAEKLVPFLQDGPVDFRVLKRYSRDVERVYTGEGWGLTGNAGVFVDPLYSPGSDFIGITNRGHVDLICRALDGEDIRERSQRMETWLRLLIDMFLRVYEDMYPLFGNAQVMSAKILFDTAFYWAWPTLLYRNGKLMDLDYIDTLGPLVPRMIGVQASAQRFFKAWHEREDPKCSGAVDQFDVVTTWRIYVSLIRQVGEKRLTQRLESNLEAMEALIEVIFRHACRDIPEIANAERIDVSQLSFEPHPALFGGPDRSEEVARVRKECETLWLHA